jgi:hypothetical protein
MQCTNETEIKCEGKQEQGDLINTIACPTAADQRVTYVCACIMLLSYLWACESVTPLPEKYKMAAGHNRAL